MWIKLYVYTSKVLKFYKCTSYWWGYLFLCTGVCDTETPTPNYNLKVLFKINLTQKHFADWSTSRSSQVLQTTYYYFVLAFDWGKKKRKTRLKLLPLATSNSVWFCLTLSLVWRSSSSFNSSSLPIIIPISWFEGELRKEHSWSDRITDFKVLGKNTSWLCPSMYIPFYACMHTYTHTFYMN